MTPLLTITAYGLPAPQGSKRHVGRGVMVESSKRVKPWRDDVKNAAERFIESQRVRGHDWQPIDAPLVVSMVFTFARPKGHYRTGRNAHLLRDAAPTRPATAPDLSKLIRSTEDALTDAGIWRDDSLVVRYHDTGKAYPDGDDLALTSPGVVIRIWRLDAQSTSGVTAACRGGDCGSCDLGNIHRPCQHDCHRTEVAPTAEPLPPPTRPHHDEPAHARPVTTVHLPADPQD